MLRRSAATVALVFCLGLAACSGEQRAAPSSADSTATPVVTPPAATATALLDRWQKPVLATLHRHRAPFTSYARDARVAASQIHDDELARAVQRSGESWASWADAVRERRDRTQVAALFARAVQDYDAAYRTADSEPPAAFSLD
jgi:hypothetical protein